MKFEELLTENKTLKNTIESYKQELSNFQTKYENLWEKTQKINNFDYNSTENNKTNVKNSKNVQNLSETT